MTLLSVSPVLSEAAATSGEVIFFLALRVRFGELATPQAPWASSGENSVLTESLPLLLLGDSKTIVAGHVEASVSSCFLSCASLADLSSTRFS